MIGIAYPNLITATTAVSGGSWLAALPLTNVRNIDYSRVARSTDATVGSTEIFVDHGSAKSARVLILAATNLSASATIRWKRGTTNDSDNVANSGSLNAWAFVPLVYNGKNHNIIIVLPSTTSARYDTIEITDTTNPAGYVDVGYLWISDLFIPTVSAAYGLKDELVDLSSGSRSESGAFWPVRRRKLRATSFVLEWLSQSEADVLHELQRVAGTTEPVVYIPDLDDRNLQQRYGGIGVLSELSPIDYPFVNIRSLPLRWVEYA